MATGVRVHSLEAMQRFRMQLLIFVEKAKGAVDEARNEVNRTAWWLRYDRLPYWQRELRRREARVNEARNDLMAARMMKTSESHAGERQRLIKAELALEEAQEKLRLLKLWLRRFEGDARTSLSQCQRLANALDLDLPRGAIVLGNLIDRLQQYLDDDVPQAAMPPPPADASPVDERPAGNPPPAAEESGHVT